VGLLPDCGVGLSGALDAMSQSSGWKRFFKGLGLSVLVYGVLILVGLAQGQTDPLFPLKGAQVSRSPTSGAQTQGFKVVTSVRELDLALTAARLHERPVLLDFYADWCISCKEMDRDTFGNADVSSVLQGFDLLRADVTGNTDQDRALLKRFNLVGPPGVIFFRADGREVRERRVIGFMGPPDFLKVLQDVAKP